MVNHRHKNYQLGFGIERSFERVNCRHCQTKSSAFKTEFDSGGTIWQITCFQCGRVVSGTPEGEFEDQLRHKCHVRYVLG